MDEKKSVRKDKQSATKAPKSKAFTDEELAAMREHAAEQRAARRDSRADQQADAEGEVLAKIASMQAHDRAIGQRLHAIIKANAPSLSPRLWYGMPAYANKEGQVVCFYQDAKKFKTRYATFGFSDKAHLDEGNMWPNAYALKGLTPTEEARIIVLVKKAMS